jgi:hypothetical protein
MYSAEPAYQSIPRELDRGGAGAVIRGRLAASFRHPCAPRFTVGEADRWAFPWPVLLPFRAAIAANASHEYGISNG